MSELLNKMILNLEYNSSVSFRKWLMVWSEDEEDLIKFDEVGKHTFSMHHKFLDPIFEGINLEQEKKFQIFVPLSRVLDLFYYAHDRNEIIIKDEFWIGNSGMIIFSGPKYDDYIVLFPDRDWISQKNVNSICHYGCSGFTPHCMTKGYVYAPYVPLIVTPLFEDDFSPKTSTRYSQKMIKPQFYKKLIV